jgi:Ni/Co efflux regulator RcnB
MVDGTDATINQNSHRGTAIGCPAGSERGRHGTASIQQTAASTSTGTNHRTEKSKDARIKNSEIRVSKGSEIPKKRRWRRGQMMTNSWKDCQGHVGCDMVVL